MNEQEWLVKTPYTAIIGLRFGKLVVENIYRKDGKPFAHCVCDCGNTKEVYVPDLKRGMTKSCGCYRRDFRKVDLTGQRFNHLTVIRTADDDMKHHGQKWICRCDCGNEVTIRMDGLQSGHVKSCGCINRRRTTHGQAKTKLFKVWTSMKQRCQNPNDTRYKDYGARGITVCSEWQEFEPFYKWAFANGYEQNLTIDRVDNNGNYCPENCRWTTRKVQMSNRRNTVYLEYCGESKSISEWSSITGISRHVLDNRMRSGWTVERILTEQVKHTKQKEIGMRGETPWQTGQECFDWWMNHAGE